MSCPCINYGTKWGRELTPSPGTHLPPRPPPFSSSCPLPHGMSPLPPAVATSPRENQGTRLALHGMLSPARSLQPGPVAPGPSYTEHKTGVKAGELPSITAPTLASPTPRHSRPLGPGKGWLQHVGRFLLSRAVALHPSATRGLQRPTVGRQDGGRAPPLPPACRCPAGGGAAAAAWPAGGAHSCGAIHWQGLGWPCVPAWAPPPEQ